MNYSKAYNRLEKHNQLHLLNYYDKLSGDEQQELLNQINDIDFNLFDNMLDIVRQTVTWLNIFIMTSENNHKQTVNFIEKHRFFGYKYETLATDLVKLLETCLPYEVKREEEFAPIKNLNGKYSVESASTMLMKKGIEL